MEFASIDIHLNLVVLLACLICRHASSRTTKQHALDEAWVWSNEVQGDFLLSIELFVILVSWKRLEVPARVVGVVVKLFLWPTRYPSVLSLSRILNSISQLLSCIFLSSTLRAALRLLL